MKLIKTESRVEKKLNDHLCLLNDLEVLAECLLINKFANGNNEILKNRMLQLSLEIIREVSDLSFLKYAADNKLINNKSDE